jgi:hypothetical protein
MIILLDQSTSMSRRFGGTQLGSGKKKSEMVATVLNSLLHELIKANTVGAEIKSRAEIAVLGYGKNGKVQNALDGFSKKKEFLGLNELNDHPLRVEVRARQEVNNDGEIVEANVYFPVWVEPTSGGSTPMCAALRKAKQLAENWANTHMENYPPVIINVTDGDPTGLARKLSLVHTNDGQALLFNCHITDKNVSGLAFPDNVAAVPSDRHAQLLFSLSSEIPNSARENIRQATGQELPSGARGFIFNGDAGSVRQMFVFATVGAQSQDPNR